ncbi:MAG: DUF4293 domain-containing protein [Bacteroidales bacterium]
MLQRLQSLYMFLGVLVAIMMFFIPLASFGLIEGQELQLKFLVFDPFLSYGIKKQTLLTPVITNIIVAVLLLINIFLYKNRKLQRRILMIIVVINLATLGTVFLAADQISNLSQVGNKAIYEVGTYLPLVIMILLVLANNGIRKDDKLVKSADRLR